MTTYKNTDFVYVDPEAKKVVGFVQWGKDGIPVPLEMKETTKKEGDKNEDDDPKKNKKRRPRKRYYPWGSYQSMKKLYRIEGKEKEVENYKSFDDALGKALNEPFWD